MGLNLHGLVRGAITSVNPDTAVTVRFSTGAALQPNRSRVPTYSAPVPMTAQVQSLSTGDLRQLDGLNIQGSTRKAYFYGSVDVVSRLRQTGGDLVTLPDGVYLTTAVLERWPDWCCVALTLQMDPAT